MSQTPHRKTDRIDFRSHSGDTLTAYLAKKADCGAPQIYYLRAARSGCPESEFTADEIWKLLDAWRRLLLEASPDLARDFQASCVETVAVNEAVNLPHCSGL
jgi:hypothetical protein